MRVRDRTLVIRTDANVQIGTGHMMRCMALAQAWQDEGGRVTFITACRNEALLQRLHDEGFAVRLLAQSYPETADWETTEQILNEFPQDWVVLDGYHFDEKYQQQIKAAGHPLLVIDDMAHLKHYYADIVLNQNLHAVQLKYECHLSTHLLSGTRYTLLRRDFRQRQNKRRVIPDVAKRVLVTLGGSDPENITMRIIEALRRLNVPDLEAKVVIGGSNPHAAELADAVKRNDSKFILLSDVKNMPELMAWADVAVSGGGTTVWELVYMGVPMLVLGLADNQLPNVVNLRKAGVAMTVDLQDKANLQEVERILPELIKDKKLRTALAGKCRAVVDGSGVDKVIDAILALN